MQGNSYKEIVQCFNCNFKTPNLMIPSIDGDRELVERSYMRKACLQTNDKGQNRVFIPP